MVVLLSCELWGCGDSGKGWSWLLLIRVVDTASSDVIQK